LPWRDLTAELGPVTWQRQVVSIIRSRDKLERILHEQMPRKTPAPPPIDFRRRQAVLVAVGPRSSTGYVLRVIGVVERRESVRVTLRERTPTLGDRTAARLTYPYRLITIPTGDKPVRVGFAQRP
jgi:hypothetical protein